MHIKRSVSDGYVSNFESYASRKEFKASGQQNATWQNQKVTLNLSGEKATIVHFDLRLKPFLDGLDNMRFPSEKEERLTLKINALLKENFPVSNLQCLQDIFHNISRIKMQHAASENPGTPATFTLNIEGEPCEVDIYPFYDNTRGDDKIKLRHEAILSFIHPGTKKVDERKHLQRGSSKYISYGWLMGKQPQRIVRAVTPFKQAKKKGKLSDSTFSEIQRKLAKTEVVYLKLFNQEPGFPKTFKSHDLKDKNIIIMKHYPCDLFFKLSEKRTIDDQSKIQIIKDVFTEIDTMHGMGICHRDIKFENFLIDSKGNPIICDFGYCSKADDLEEINTPRGTIPCMSVERLENYFLETKISKEAILASDVWAAGQLAAAVLWNIPIPTIAVDPENFKPDIQTIKEQIEMLSADEPPEEDQLTHLIWETLHIDPIKRPKADEIVKRLTNIQVQYEQKEPTYTITRTNDYWSRLLSRLKQIPMSENKLNSSTGYSEEDFTPERDWYSSSTSS
jgi:serine/threonine protein kinase